MGLDHGVENFAVSSKEWEYQFMVEVAVLLPAWVMHLGSFLNNCDPVLSAPLASAAGINTAHWDYSWCRNRDANTNPWMPKMHSHLIWERDSDEKATMMPMTCKNFHHGSKGVFCQGTLHLDIRNFLSSSDNRDVSQLAALGDKELHSLAEIELISDSDIPFSINSIIVKLAKRIDSGPVPQLSAQLVEHHPSRNSLPNWIDQVNTKWTLIDRCQVGDINWCRPSSDGFWFWSNMFDFNSMGFNIEGQNNAVEREFHIGGFEEDSGFDLNEVFAQIKVEQKLGCPNKGYTCGPIRQNRYCNGHQGRTHCHKETGNCVDPVWAADEGLDVFNEWRHDNLHETCKAQNPKARDLVARGRAASPVTWTKVVYPDWDVEKDNAIYRPILEQHCSTGDVWASNFQEPNGAWMIPVNMGRKPIDWEVGVSNISFFGESDKELGLGATMWGKPKCEHGFTNIGMAFMDMDTDPSVDDFRDLSRHDFCCVPNIETRMPTLEDLGQAGKWPIASSSKCMAVRIGSIEGFEFRRMNFADSCDADARVSTWRDN